jgi:hypothetical protein
MTISVDRRQPVGVNVYELHCYDWILQIAWHVGSVMTQQQFIFKYRASFVSSRSCCTTEPQNLWFISLYVYDNICRQKAASGRKCLWIALLWLNLTNCMACRLSHDPTAVHFQVPYVICEFSVMLYYRTTKFVVCTLDIQVFLDSSGSECRCGNKYL